MKKRIFVLVMCAAMMISSFAVMAAEREFGGGGTYAIARLSTNVVDGVPSATATTTPLTGYSSIRTIVRWGGPYGSNDWTPGTTWAGQNAVSVTEPSYAESYHYIDTVSTYLIVYR